MTTRIYEEGGKRIIAVEGDLDTRTCPQFQEDTKPILGSGADVILDCAGLDYVSSWGLRVILMLHNDLSSSGGSFRLRGVKENVRRVLALTGFLNVLDVE